MERPDLNDSSPLQSYPRSPGEIPLYTPDFFNYFLLFFLNLLFVCSIYLREKVEEDLKRKETRDREERGYMVLLRSIYIKCF